ncbi:radical SAM protein [Natranaerobius trueperi]|uniref:Radical SAM protein n=1 Tax=Natranaerobius trueperi TaxID=759412 RepID=A0A226C2M0_9FIRM|nr:radical SAM protein [Natranaerobius trueperi]OWZ84689.1 radical SAM protein [Natranaerobius trueperi]
MNYKQLIGSTVIDQGLKYIDKDPLNNIPKLLAFMRKFAAFDHHKKALKSFERSFKDPTSNWFQLTKKVLDNYDFEIIKKFISNFILNSVILGKKVNEDLSKTHDCNIPWAILMDPTAACNLKCEGCWAGDYHKSTLGYDTMNRIITEGKELGIYMYIFSGGEPMLKNNEIIDLAKKHNDCAFLSFTNGTLINKELASKLREVGNIALAISIDGFEAISDKRRGLGTYGQIRKAMEILKSYSVPFGFSTTYHAYNTDIVASEDYINEMIDSGCLFGWYFTYMPIGKNETSNMLASPKQRATMYKQINRFRKEKPIFLIDFWNDGEFSGGCIAGGRNYIHINANGDVEPCAFIHYANVNIKDTTLLEALKSPLFKEYKDKQPFDENPLRPCPLLDKPEMLEEMVYNSNAYSTHLFEEESVEHLTSKCKNTANEWAKMADKLWNKKHN